MTNVLFVVSAADHWTLKDGSEHPTGFWAEELAEPHRIFTEAGFDVTIAAPNGVAPTLDRVSIGPMGGSRSKREKIVDYLKKIKDQIDHPVNLSEVNHEEYDLVFYPGGHGPMEDLATDATSGKILLERAQSGRTVAVLCHAPAALLAAKTNTGNAFAGFQVTGLSNLEERFNPFSFKAKWLLEDALKDAGLKYEKNKLPYMSKVVVDRNLYSGQNPQSSVALAERLVEDLRSDVKTTGFTEKNEFNAGNAQ